MEIWKATVHKIFQFRYVGQHSFEKERNFSPLFTIKRAVSFVIS